MATTKLDKIVNRLRHYPFTEKILLCQTNATRIMKTTHLDIFNTPNAIYPWELEVFAELSLFADGSNPNKSFKAPMNNDFIKIINIIRNYRHSFLKKQKNMDFANAFIMVTGLQQFKSQENILHRIYRYNYFWNFANDKIDMKKVFSGHFNGLEYGIFRELGVLIFFYASLENTTPSVIQALALKYIDAVNLLKITREDYKAQQSEKNDDNYENVIYGFNYLHPYPFVEYKGCLFLPLPYLIVDAVTESLLTRVTVDNALLREQIGKEVAQSYIEKIFKDSGIYEEVLPETEYHVRKNKIDSPDILIKQDENFCFIDTKLSSPKLEIRKFNKEEIEKTTARYAKNIIQMYKRITDFREGHYYPFVNKIDVSKDNLFGIVALLEDSYISRRVIYEEVCKQLKIDSESEEAMFIKSHISITNFRDLEMFAFRCRDIFVSLKKKRDNPHQWNDLGLFNDELFSKIPAAKNFDLDTFITLNQKTIMESINYLVDNRVIKKS